MAELTKKREMLIDRSTYYALQKKLEECTIETLEYKGKKLKASADKSPDFTANQQQIQQSLQKHRYKLQNLELKSNNYSLDI